ncbi:MAG: Kiwa anti-phage protein KwaB-like domain-containing protein [Candidatus Saccharibacteria bacterium]
MDEEAVSAIADQEPITERTDVFLWANNLVPIKEELDIDLFLFNKNYVVYRTKVSKDLVRSFQPLLIDGLLEYVLQGAAEGLQVRDFEDGEAEDNVLQRTRLANVQKAQELLNWVKTQESVIENFVEEEHDLKRVKGVLARCRHKDIPYPFYIIKLLPGSMVMKGATSWMLRDGKFVPFDAEGSMRMPGDNQLLVLDQDIYAFSQTRLEQLFGYNAKKYGIALKKMQEIQANFTFNFDIGLSWENLVQGQKSLVNKLQKIDASAIKQSDLMDHAEELGINLMTDNDGAIIIMDVKDLTKFINLLNDDYIESPLTGRRYEIKSKKPLRVTEGASEDMAFGASE